MTVTVDLDPDAVWEDGTPVTVADIECTWRAALNTPGSILRDQGYDRITAVTEGASDRQAVIEFAAVYAPYRTLFDRIIKAAAVADCDDISGDFSTAMPISGRALRIDSFGPEQLLLVPNEAAWSAGVPPVRQVVMVPLLDRAAELAALESGAVDFIHPQFDGSLPTQFADPNIAVQVGNGAEYEALYFQQRDGPFADPVFREAFSKSIDREGLYAAIYQPIFAAAGIDGELHNCGPVLEGPYCPAGIFATTFDPAAAAALLTDAGWVRDSSGFWSKDGVVPEIRWVVNDDSARRQAAQTYLIPLLAEAGFHVVADNCDFRCVFLQRLPTLDYDLAMYLSNARADPGYLTPQFTCDQVPTEQNSFEGRNQLGWCNQEASEALYRRRRDARARTARPARAGGGAGDGDRPRADPIGDLPGRQGVADGPARRSRRCRLAENARVRQRRAVDRPRWRRPDRHRRRAVAELPQPGDVVRRLLLVRVDGLGPDAPRHLADHRAAVPMR